MPRTRRRRRLLTAVLVLAVLGWVGHVAEDDDSTRTAEASAEATTPTTAPPATAPRTTTPRTTTPPPAPSARPARATPTATPRAGAALAALATLRVKGRAPMTGYDRDRFGQTWADVDRNGCDQRNDVLGRDLDVTTYKPQTRDCVVLAGTFDDPYSGRRIAFTRGEDSSRAVQIDHVVALADAWQTGAQRWGPRRLETFANDPLVLMAADGPLNAAKGAADAATWLPPNKAFRCAYVARQVAIKAKYDLWVKPAERDAIGRVLTTCPAQTLPAAGEVRAPDDRAPAAAARPAHTAPPRASAPVVDYENCDAVRAAGRAPIRRGEPGYAPKLDRDGDGLGCDT